MNHCHFVQSVDGENAGGIFSAAAQLSASLSRTGTESKLVGITQKSTFRGSAVGGYRAMGPVKACFSIDLLNDSRKLVAESNIIHGHGFYTASNWIMGREARLQNKPLVYHVHGIFEPWITCRSVWKKRMARFLFEDANFLHSGLWRALTLKEEGQIRSQGVKAPIVVCPNGIDLEGIDSFSLMGERGTLKRHRRCLLFLGRVHEKKGLDILLNAWAGIERSKRIDWEIKIVGPDDGARFSLLRLASTLGIQNDVSFVDAVGGSEKFGVFANADAFVLPSRSEGFSVAILEALAFHLPVVITTACNFPEVEESGAGWCSDVSMESLRSSLKQLLNTSDVERNQRGHLGRELVENNYTWAVVASQLNDACRSVFAL